MRKETTTPQFHLYGEQEYAVPPLELPSPEHLDPQTLADCESTALFMQQARRERPTTSAWSYWNWVNSGKRPSTMNFDG